MSKKDFSGGFGNLLGENKTAKKETIEKETAKKTTAKPVEKAKRTQKKTAQVEMEDKDVRATFIAKESKVKKVKAIAYWEREDIKVVFDKILDDAIAKYERKNGPIQPVPEKKK